MSKEELNEVLNRIRDIMIETGVTGAVTLVAPDTNDERSCISAKFEKITAPYSCATWFKAPDGKKGIYVAPDKNLPNRGEVLLRTMDMFRLLNKGVAAQSKMFEDIDMSVLVATLKEWQRQREKDKSKTNMN